MVVTLALNQVLLQSKTTMVTLYIEGSLWHSNSIASGARGGDLDKDNQRIDKMRS